MKRIIFLSLMLFPANILCLSFQDIKCVAEELNVSEDEINRVLSFWKGIKLKNSLICAYKKKKKIKNLDPRIKKAVSLDDMVLSYPEIQILKFKDKEFFHYDSFPISIFSQREIPEGFFEENRIAFIPHGIGFSRWGIFGKNNTWVLDGIYQWDCKDSLKKSVVIEPKKISGKVAFVTGYNEYYSHWMHDVLGRLIMLQIAGVEYDKLYIACDKPYQKETLLALGIDLKKIVKQEKWFECIQADELICPSLPAKRIFNDTGIYETELFSAYYYRDWVIKHLRNVFLPLAEKLSANFSKKIFISRKDAKQRRIKNEDEVFGLFEKKGFKRYCLSELSVIEQVALFHNAEIIVGPHSSAFLNWIFCKPKTQVVEIFQGRLDLSFFYIAQQMHLQYDYIKTMGFLPGDAHVSTEISCSIITSFLENKKY